VNVDVQIEGSPEPLDDSHRAPTTICDAGVARAGAQEAEHRPKEHGDHPAAHVVIPRQLVPHPVREAERDTAPYARRARPFAAITTRMACQHLHRRNRTEFEAGAFHIADSAGVQIWRIGIPAPCGTAKHLAWRRWLGR
jgi:hypothetical protein